MSAKFPLGRRATCRHSGFTGIVIARCIYLDDLPRVQVLADGLTDGKIVAEWFPESQVAVMHAVQNTTPNRPPQDESE